MIKNRLLKNRITYLVLLILSIIYFIFANDGISIGIFLILLILPLISLIVTLISKRHLQINNYLSKDNKIIYQANRILKVNFACQITNNLFNQTEVINSELLSNSSEVELSNLIVGNNLITIENIMIEDYFSLFAFRFNYAFKGEINILPRLGFIDLDVTNKLIDVSNNELYKQSTYSKISSDYSTYREYVPGDSLKGVNWKLASKLDKLFVKVEEEKIDNSYAIFFCYDVSKEDVKLLDLLYSVSYKLISTKKEHKVIVYNKYSLEIMCFEIADFNSLDEAILKIIGMNLGSFDIDKYIEDNLMMLNKIVIGDYQGQGLILTKEDLYE